MDGLRFELRCPEGVCIVESADGQRIFEGAPSSAELNGFVVQNSMDPSRDGGAIRLTGGELKMVNMNLRLNQARNGGALYVENGGVVDIVNSRFASNSATEVSTSCFAFARKQLS